jgi:hypothetical protein
VELVICLLLVAYLFPFVVAARRDHPRIGRILAANLVLGWTVVGWAWVLHRALRPPPPPAEPIVLRRRGPLRLLAPPADAPPDGARARPAARRAHPLRSIRS